MINNRKELYDFLKSQDYNKKKDTSMSSVYFLVEYNDIIEPIYFTPFMDVFFESPCSLYEYDMDVEDIPKYVEEMYEKKHYDEALVYTLSMYRNGKLYEIENFQCEPFLPDKINNIKMISESECLSWLLRNKKIREA